MKKLLCILFIAVAILLSLLLTSCGGNTTANSSPQELIVGTWSRSITTRPANNLMITEFNKTFSVDGTWSETMIITINGDFVSDVEIRGTWHLDDDFTLVKLQVGGESCGLLRTLPWEGSRNVREIQVNGQLRSTWFINRNRFYIGNTSGDSTLIYSRVSD